MGPVSLYEKDFYAWTQEQARLIKEKALDKLDLTHLFEEIESMGAKERSKLKNRLAQLLTHLLKWKYHSAWQCISWQNTIYDQREELQELLKDNPSLNAKLDEFFPRSYTKAVREAVSETGLDDSFYPKQCEWTMAQTLADDFFPN
jgi:hypothetical protein